MGKREWAIGVASIIAFVAALMATGWLKWVMIGVWAVCLVELTVAVMRKSPRR